MNGLNLKRVEWIKIDWCANKMLCKSLFSQNPIKTYIGEPIQICVDSYSSLFTFRFSLFTYSQATIPSFPGRGVQEWEGLLQL